MRFIGNKEKLVEWIYDELKFTNLKGGLFFDFFSGTTNVGKHFKKKGYQIISSDLLYTSYVLQKAYIENNEEPKFSGILKDIEEPLNLFPSSELEMVLNYLDGLEPKKGFIYENYTPEGTVHLDAPRMFFTSENGKKIDAIRIQINEWFKDNLISEQEYFILIACLIETVPFYANISGVYAAFHKKWDPRAIKPLKLRPIEIISNDKKNLVFNTNSIELIKNFDYDIIYLDPPYNSRQYAPNYHLLETISKYDSPEIRGVAGLRDYSKQKSTFCVKSKALEELEYIVSQANFKYLVLSYNCEGIMKTDDILNVLKKYGELSFKEYKYLRYKSNNNGDSNKKKFINEQLFILKKLVS
ncbi:DNA adenine methylase [Salinimicrobium soli]|uniref:DNA adenine methylase n=1 Tax=Salinimicrobium soli TaxID=1254399 RepID=UPI003AADE300